MQNVGFIVTHVSGQLSDQTKGREFTRWNRNVAIEYMNEGLKEIGAYRPEAFAVTKQILLQSGRVQSVGDGSEIQSIESNTDGSPVNKGNAEIMKAFGAYALCVPKINTVNGIIKYAVRSFAVDEADPKTFYVEPPVPFGATGITVIATINSKPPEYTLADWNKPCIVADKFYNNLIDYMMARAYQRDTESQVSQGQASRLFSLFYQAMGVKYKMESARNSGYYRGEVGTGDPRSAAT